MKSIGFFLWYYCGMSETIVNINPVIAIKKNKNDLISPDVRPSFNTRRLNGSDISIAMANKKANAKANCEPIPIEMRLLLLPKYPTTTS